MKTVLPNSLRNIMKVHFLIVGVSGLAVGLTSLKQLFPFVAGAGLITVNFGLLTWLWKRILDKKPVAITLAIVVFKYAILAAVLYIFVREWKLSLYPLLAGLATLGASFVVVAVQSQISQNQG